MDTTKIITVLLMMIIFAIFVQFIVERIKDLMPKFIMDRIPSGIIASFVGITFAIAFDIKLFMLIGLNTNWIAIDYFFSGLILSAGAPAIHELIASVRETRKQIENK